MPTELSRFQILSTRKIKPTQLVRNEQTAIQTAADGSVQKKLQEDLNLSYFLADENTVILSTWPN
jgi:hypothetical protein